MSSNDTRCCNVFGWYNSAAIYPQQNECEGNIFPDHHMVTACTEGTRADIAQDTEGTRAVLGVYICQYKLKSLRIRKSL